MKISLTSVSECVGDERIQHNETGGENQREDEEDGEEVEWAGEREEVTEELELLEEINVTSKEKGEEIKLKRASIKIRQERMTAYLLSLCLQKKKEEKDMKRIEDRKRKRVLILSLRLQNEAMEKKLMGKEDKFQNGSQVIAPPMSENPRNATLLMKSAREKEKERRMCHKDKEKEKDKKKKKNIEKDKKSMEVYDSSDKDDDEERINDSK